jgi:hypothetical protein
MYAFRHLYKVENTRPRLVSEDLGQVLGDVFVWLHLQLHKSRTVTWGALLDEWERSWGKACKSRDSRGCSDLAEETKARNRGARHLRDTFDSIRSEMDVLAINYPCRREISGFLIEGTIPVIRVLEEKDKGRSGREIQLISVDPVGIRTPCDIEAGRNFQYVISKFGLELELRSSFRDLAHNVSSMVYLPRIPKLARIKLTEDAGRQAIRWASWVVESINLGHFYPRAGEHCVACYYRPTCDIRYVSNRALSRSATPSKIRSRLCQTSS